MSLLYLVSMSHSSYNLEDDSHVALREPTERLFHSLLRAESPYPRKLEQLFQISLIEKRKSLGQKRFIVLFNQISGPLPWKIQFSGSGVEPERQCFQ